MERDLGILEALARYRYLRTSQISRLLFPENRTIQSARRRLKYLFHAGLVGRIQPIMGVQDGPGEIAYYLDRKGRGLLNEDAFPAYSHKNHVKPGFLNHALDVSEFRLCLELAIQPLEDISLHRVVADYELKSHAEQAIGRRRYRLYDEVVDPVARRTLTVYPDLMFVLKADHGPEKVFQRLFFVEIDRGTEGLRVISDKLAGYHLYKSEKVYRKFGDFNDFRVLIQTNSAKRQQNIQMRTREFSDVVTVWTAMDSLVTSTSILKDKIWENPDGEPAAILRQ